jgi:hypothetical protein
MHDVIATERPPMATVPAYISSRAR